MLVVLDIILCMGPLLKVQFQLVIDVSGEVKQYSKYGLINHHGLFC